MHIVDGIGDVKGLVRENIPKRKGGDKMAKRAGPGESSYTAYDRDIAARAQVWLHEEAPKWRDEPWVLFVSFVLPHFPLTAPPHWFYRYWQQDLPMPKRYAKDERPHHPYLDTYAHTVDYDSHFASRRRRQARDRRLRGPRVGDGRERRHVLRALRDAGLATRTRVIYTSDHGDNVGRARLVGQVDAVRGKRRRAAHHGGPGHSRRAASSRTPVSHIDCAPDDPRGGGRAARASAAATLPGASLFDVADGAMPGAAGDLASTTRSARSRGAYMIRFGRYKYCHYVCASAAALRSRGRSRGARSTWRAIRGHAATLGAKASAGCVQRSTRKRPTRARSGGRPSCSRATAAARRRSPAATSASRPRPGTAAEMN